MEHVNSARTTQGDATDASPLATAAPPSGRFGLRLAFWYAAVFVASSLAMLAVWAVNVLKINSFTFISGLIWASLLIWWAVR